MADAWLANAAIVIAYALVIASLRFRSRRSHSAAPSVRANIGRCSARQGRCCWRSRSAPTRFNTWRCRDCCRRCWSTAAGCRSPPPEPSARSRSWPMPSATVGARCDGSACRSGASWRRRSRCGLAAIGIFADAAPVALVTVLAAASLGLTGLIPDRSWAAPRIASTSAVLAIALGLINQVTNLGNLAGPAAMAFMQSLGWGGAPLLSRRGGDRRNNRAAAARRATPRASLRLNAGFLDQAGPLRELGPDIGIERLGPV